MKNFRLTLVVLAISTLIFYLWVFLAVTFFEVKILAIEVSPLIAQGLVLTVTVFLAWKAVYILGGEQGLGLGIIFYFQLGWIIWMLARTYISDVVYDWSSLANVVFISGVASITLLIGYRMLSKLDPNVK